MSDWLKEAITVITVSLPCARHHGGWHLQLLLPQMQSALGTGPHLLQSTLLIWTSEGVNYLSKNGWQQIDSVGPTVGLFPRHNEFPSQIAHIENKKQKKLLTKMKHFSSELQDIRGTRISKWKGQKKEVVFDISPFCSHFMSGELWTSSAKTNSWQ